MGHNGNHGQTGSITVFDVVELAIIANISCNIASKPVEPLKNGRVSFAVNSYSAQSIHTQNLLTSDILILSLRLCSSSF